MTTNNRAVFFSLAFLLLLPAMAISMINVALPQIAVEFNAPVNQLNWVQLAYLTATTSLVLIAGCIGDNYGSNKSLMLGCFGIFLSSIGCALSPSIFALVLFRILQGISAAVMLALVWSAAKQYSQQSHNGKTMGLMASATATGTAIGPVIAGALLYFSNWRAVFWLLALIALVGLFICHFMLPSSHRSQHSPKQLFDWTGSTFLIIACTSFVLLTTHNLNHEYLALFILSLLMFIRAQYAAKSPLLPLALFCNKQRNLILLGSFLIDATAMSTLIIGSYYLTRGLALAPEWVGVMLAIGPITSAIIGVPAGKLVDKTGTHRALFSGLCVFCVGTLGYAFMPPLIAMTGYAISLVVMACGRQLYLAACYSQIMLAAEQGQTGKIAGLINLIKQLGLLSGTALSGAIFSNQLPAPGLPHASSKQLDIAFTNTFIIALLPLLLVTTLLFFSHVKIQRNT